MARSHFEVAPVVGGGGRRSSAVRCRPGRSRQRRRGSRPRPGPRVSVPEGVLGLGHPGSARPATAARATAQAAAMSRPSHSGGVGVDRWRRVTRWSTEVRRSRMRPTVDGAWASHGPFCGDPYEGTGQAPRVPLGVERRGGAGVTEVRGETGDHGECVRAGARAVDREDLAFRFSVHSGRECA